MSVNYKVATVGDIDGVAYREDTDMRPVRHHFGISAFGTNAWHGQNVGDRLIPSHTEDPGSQELYVVLEGHARFEIDGESVDAPAGTLVYCAPEADRTAFAEEAGTVVLAVGSTVGEAYHGGGWEVWAPFHPQYEAGVYEAVIDLAKQTLEGSGYAAPR
jgi:mannose-6-phosphate isomerase-like protein (cupin superfamily)